MKNKNNDIETLQKALADIHHYCCRGAGHDTPEMTANCIISKFIDIRLAYQEDMDELRKQLAEAKKDGELIRELHYRLTNLTDSILGPAETMVIEKLVERLEENELRIKKAIEFSEQQTNSSLTDEQKIEIQNMIEENINTHRKIYHY